MAEDKNLIPVGFNQPTKLPRDAQENEEWQKANRSWWERNPMRYDWDKPLTKPEFSKEFYEEIDARFFAAAKTFMPPQQLPFDQLIPYDSLPTLDVLEIGVGNGSHAQLIASHAKSYVGIDLTEYGVKSTTARLRHFGIDNAEIRRMDAEQLDFPDGSFDLVWSWGVIHASGSPDRILAGMHRVLRPGGRAITMVYHRSFWIKWVVNFLFRGVLRGDLFRTRSLHRTMQENTDGAMGRYYLAPEWERLVAPWFRVTEFRVYGNKSLLVPLPPGRLKDRVVKTVPDSLSRFLLGTCRQGMLLVAIMERRDDGQNRS